MEGTIVGTYFDGDFLRHGFLRTSDGKFTIIDGPGAQKGTSTTNINVFGEVSGGFRDANNVHVCFVRAPDGRITTFIPPGTGAGDLTACSSFTTDALNDVRQRLDTASMRIGCYTAGCALPTAKSGRSTLRAQASDPTRALMQPESTGGDGPWVAD